MVYVQRVDTDWDWLAFFACRILSRVDLISTFYTETRAKEKVCKETEKEREKNKEFESSNTNYLIPSDIVPPHTLLFENIFMHEWQSDSKHIIYEYRAELCICVQMCVCVCVCCKQ